MSGPIEASATPRVVVGVAGGIAAYKAVGLVRELVNRGAHVTVIPTHSALKFVGLPTWEAISRNEVPLDLFEGVAEVRHVALGQKADLVIVAPATAHQIAQIAAGFAGDLLGTTLLATTAPVLLAPAMHTEMWQNPSVVANMATLVSRGYHVIGPETGALTGGDEGPGRMSEPAAIADYAWTLWGPKRWAGTRFLISAGGTRERIDPVRFLGNRSSGSMGVALARQALRAGAEVTLVASHLDMPPPSGVTLIQAPSVHDVRREMLEHQPSADVVVMAAAVADWIPQQYQEKKITKEDVGEVWQPVFERAPDVLQELSLRATPGQRVIGFAAETSADPQERESRARAKLARKGCHVLVLNHVGDTVGFGEVETAVTIFSQASPQSLSVEGTKDSIAERLLEVLLDR